MRRGGAEKKKKKKVVQRKRNRQRREKEKKKKSMLRALVLCGVLVATAHATAHAKQQQQQQLLLRGGQMAPAKPAGKGYYIGYEVEMPVFMAKIVDQQFVSFDNREVVYQQGVMAVTVDDAGAHSIVGSVAGSELTKLQASFKKMMGFDLPSNKPEGGEGYSGKVEAKTQQPNGEPITNTRENFLAAAQDIQTVYTTFLDECKKAKTTAGNVWYKNADWVFLIDCAKMLGGAKENFDVQMTFGFPLSKLPLDSSPAGTFAADMFNGMLGASVASKWTADFPKSLKFHGKKEKASVAAGWKGIGEAATTAANPALPAAFLRLMSHNMMVINGITSGDKSCDGCPVPAVRVAAAWRGRLGSGRQVALCSVTFLCPPSRWPRPAAHPRPDVNRVPAVRGSPVPRLSPPFYSWFLST